MAKETTTGKKPRVLGLVIVKQGDPATARRVYADARLSKTYQAWPLKQVLDDRIAQADENVALFRKEQAPVRHQPTRRLG